MASRCLHETHFIRNNFPPLHIPLIQHCFVCKIVSLSRPPRSSQIGVYFTCNFRIENNDGSNLFCHSVCCFFSCFAFCKSVWIKALGALQIETATEKPNCRVVLEWELKNYLFARGKVLGMMSSVFRVRRSFAVIEKRILTATLQFNSLTFNCDA